VYGPASGYVTVASTTCLPLPPSAGLPLLLTGIGSATGPGGSVVSAGSFDAALCTFSTMRLARSAVSVPVGADGLHVVSGPRVGVATLTGTALFRRYVFLE
jgi:hypothetical protein